MERETRALFAFSGFLFDPESGELTQNAFRVRLNKQTAELLHLLLLHAGSLVTREQIRHSLWPGGELVAHEKIINNGISRLRYVLKDDAQEPRYIERVPKRGYRLIAAVRVLERDPQQPGPATPQQEQIVAVPSPPPVEELTVVLLPTSTKLAARDTKSPRQSRTMLWQFLVGALLLAGTGFGITFLWRAAYPQAGVAAPGEISLTVAPFEASGEGAKELAEGFRLDLIDAIAQLPKVQVRAAHSADPLLIGDSSQLRDARKPQVDVVLFGHLGLTGRQAQLQLELVRGSNGTHLATLEYRSSVDELRATRDKIQQQIFDRLALVGHKGPRVLGSTSDPEAYKTYLEARFHLSQQSSESLTLAAAEFRHAIARDPDFALAYTGLARTFLVEGAHNLIPRAKSYQQAAELIGKAFQLDPSSAELHSITGFIRFYQDWDLPGAELEQRQAIQLDPNEARYHQWLALLLCDEGRFREALAEMDLALANDPYWPALYLTDVFIAGNAKDNLRALQSARKLQAMIPGSPLANDALANALWYSGQPTEAIAEWRRMAALEGDESRVRIEDEGLAAFRRAGAPGYARVRIAAIGSSGARRHPNDFEPTEWYMAAHENQLAIAALRKMAALHDPQFLDMVMSPLFDQVRNDPSFRALLVETHLTLSHSRSGEKPAIPTHPRNVPPKSPS